MRRLALTLLLCFASAYAWAASSVISTNGTTCTTATNCLVVSLPQDKGGATLVLSGTWTGTIQFEATGDGGVTWVSVNVMPLASTTAVTSATANGTWQVNTAGFTGLRMRSSASMTGSATATITPSAASARNGGGGAGGGVSSFSSGNLSPLFTTSVATPTTTPALSFTLSNFAADSIYGNFTGSSAAPSTQSISSCANDGAHALVYTGHTLTCETVVRTWLFAMQGTCQAGNPAFNILWLSTNGPAATGSDCTTTTITPEWQIPASDATKVWYYILKVPVGHTGSYTTTITFRSAAITGTASLQLKTACVANGAVPDNPTFTNDGSAITLTPAGTTLQDVTASGTFTGTCADGAFLYVQYTFASNTVASPIQFRYADVSIQASL